MSERPFAAPQPLPVDVSDSRSVGWWGMIFALIAQAAILTTFVVSYYYLGASSGRWPPPGITRPALPWAVVGLAVHLTAAVPAYWAAASIRAGQRGRVVLGLAAAIGLGLAALGIALFEYGRQGFEMTANAYASAFLTIVGFHAVATIGALGMTAAVLVWTLLGYYNERRNLAIQNTALYWYYLIASWVVVLAVLYLSPYAIDL